MKILVVDDSLTVRQILRRELEGGGLEVVEAKDGETALQLLPQVQPDLITLDVEMPGMNGFVACARFREVEEELGREPTPVVFVTSMDTLEDRERGFELGAADFIVKPSQPGEILERVRRILAAREPLKGLVALVVEDSDVAMRVIASALREEGVVVHEAPSGEAALTILAAETGALDLVITDYLMPGIKGDELCARIRETPALERVPVIAVSAMSEKERILDMFRAGATDYLLKPFVKEELLARIRVHLDVRALNRKLERQVAELEQLNQLKTDFLAAASHDLRSPVASILGFTELLRHEEGFGGELRESLDAIHQSGEYLLELVGDVLDLAQIETLKRQFELAPVDVAMIAESSVETLYHMAAPKDVALQLVNRCGERSAVVLGDELSLRRAFNALVSNAIKFTPEQGSVVVVVEPAGDGDVAVNVTDTGIGIPEAQLPKLFDKFSDAARPGTAGERSTGLGLSIARELVERQLGRIEVESKVDHGSTFRVLLPGA